MVASIDEELANDSDPDADCAPEIFSEDSADENDIPDSGLSPSIDGFFTEDHQLSTLFFKGDPAVQFPVQNGTDMMEYVDTYITPELTKIVNQTNLYA
jgi:hypothetical protein